MNDLTLGHVLADANCVVRYVDPIFCELIGLEPGDVVGRNLIDITHPDDWSDNKAAIDALLAHDRPFRMEKRYLRPDGRAVMVRNHVSLFRKDGAPPSMIAATELLSSDIRLPGAEERRNRSVHDALDRLADVVMTQQ